MNSNRKTVWIVVIVAVVIIIIGLLVWAGNSNNDDMKYDNNQQVATSTTATTTEDNGAEVGVVVGTAGLPYDQALKVYLNKRIQFSVPNGQKNTCQATPTVVTFKGGTKFMLDNRMGISARLHFSNNVVYTLPAYSFQVITLNTPATYTVDCNSSQNVSTVQIQK